MGLDDVDAARVAAVGVCMGGGYALVAGRPRAPARRVASVAGGYDIGGTFQQMMGAEGLAAYLRTVNELRDRERDTGETHYVPTIAHGLSDDVPVAVMPNARGLQLLRADHARPRADLVVGDHRRLARAVPDVQRRRSSAAPRPDAAADRARHDRRRPAPGVRAGRL